MRTALCAVLISAACSASAGCADKEFIRLDQFTIDGEYLNADFTYVGEQPIRLLDANFGFFDVLGNYISGYYGFERGTRASNGDRLTISGRYGSAGLQEVAAIHKDDVVVEICVKGLVFEDGTKITF